jgi:hypothetical protein
VCAALTLHEIVRLRGDPLCAPAFKRNFHAAEIIFDAGQNARYNTCLLQ